MVLRHLLLAYLYKSRHIQQLELLFVPYFHKRAQYLRKARYGFQCIERCSVGFMDK